MQQQFLWQILCWVSSVIVLFQNQIEKFQRFLMETTSRAPTVVDFLYMAQPERPRLLKLKYM